MATCIITGLNTDRKWKGKSLHPIVLHAAKKVREQQKDIGLNRPTLRDAINWLVRDLKSNLATTELTNEEYFDFLVEYFQRYDDVDGNVEIITE